MSQTIELKLVHSFSMSGTCVQHASNLVHPAHSFSFQLRQVGSPLQTAECLCCCCCMLLSQAIEKAAPILVNSNTDDRVLGTAPALHLRDSSQRGNDGHNHRCDKLEEENEPVKTQDLPIAKLWVV